MIVLVVMLFGLLALSDFPPLLKSGKRYDIIVLSGLYALGLALVTLQVFDVSFPGPIKGLQILIVDVLKIGYPES